MIEIVIWNIGLKKDRDFWDYLETFDVIGMCEKWIEERYWMSLKMRLLKNFTWNTISI